MAGTRRRCRCKCRLSLWTEHLLVYSSSSLAFSCFVLCCMSKRAVQRQSLQVESADGESLPNSCSMKQREEQGIYWFGTFEPSHESSRKAASTLLNTAEGVKAFHCLAANKSTTMLVRSARGRCSERRCHDRQRGCQSIRFQPDNLVIETKRRSGSWVTISCVMPYAADDCMLVTNAMYVSQDPHCLSAENGQRSLQHHQEAS